MIDKTPAEEQALASTLRPLGEVVAEIGMNKPLSAYTRVEVLRAMEAVVDAWQKWLLDNNCPPKQPEEGTSFEEEPF